MRVGRYINEVCQLFDLTVLTDIEAINNEDETDFRIKTCVAIGQEGERQAGLPYIVVTNWFPNEEELDEFCEVNINRFRIAAAECELGAVVPDATEWR